MCSVQAPPLNKLAQLVTDGSDSPSGVVGADATLTKRARAKLVTNTLVLQLVNLDSPLKKAYWNTYHCAKVIEQRGKTLKTKYCKNRWCLVCNRIRTAILIRGYEDSLTKLHDSHFVTLTFPNVSADVLREEIKGMYDRFNKIKRRLRKRGIKLRGIRKLECTFNQGTRMYHPHYHLIIEGKEAADALLDEWLMEYPSAVRDAQLVVPTNDGSIKELMKYFTKILPSKKSKTDKLRLHPESLDVMFQAMQGLRVFQPLGIAKSVSEDIEDLEKKEYDVLEQEYAVWLWEQDCSDWLDVLTFEPLTDYCPEPVTLRFIELIRNDGGA